MAALSPIQAFRRDGFCSPEHFGVLDEAIRALKAELAETKRRLSETLAALVMVHEELAVERHATAFQKSLTKQYEKELHMTVDCGEPDDGCYMTGGPPSCVKHLARRAEKAEAEVDKLKSADK